MAWNGGQVGVISDRTTPAGSGLLVQARKGLWRACRSQERMTAGFVVGQAGNAVPDLAGTEGIELRCS